MTDSNHVAEPPKLIYASPRLGETVDEMKRRDELMHAYHLKLKRLKLDNPNWPHDKSSALITPKAKRFPRFRSPPPLVRKGKRFPRF